MKLELRNNKDFWAGMMLIGIGAAAMFIARDYRFGSALRMGPGFFPTFLGGMLILFGVAIMATGLVRNEKIQERLSVRALILLLRRADPLRHPDESRRLLPALVALILVSAAAGSEFKLREVLLLTVTLTFLSVALFIWGLGLPFTLIQGFERGRPQEIGMEVFNNLIFGFSVALSLQNLTYCLIGCLVGTLIGVLPGIGPMATIAMLLPLTFKVPPVAALIMLAGIYYGAMYGGSTTSILVNLPGETASVVTCIDGYQMARQGRAGAALAISAIGSFFAGTVCTLLIALLGPPIADMALKFGSPEYFSLMLMALVIAAVLAQGSMLKSLAMVVLGLLLGIVGTDVDSGVKRFTFGLFELADGIGFVILAVGVFAVGGNHQQSR